MDNQNPWKVENIEAFSFYCCPECDFKSKEEDYFKRHAMESHNKSRVLFITSKFDNTTNNDPLQVETDSITHKDLVTFDENESVGIIEDQLKTFDDQETFDNVEQIETSDGENYENIAVDETFDRIDINEHHAEKTKNFNIENVDNFREVEMCDKDLEQELTTFNEKVSESNKKRVDTFDKDNYDMTRHQNNSVDFARMDNFNNEMATHYADNSNAEDTIEAINESKRDIKSQCPICGKEFPGKYWQGNLQVHMKNKHKINIQKLAVKFKCDVCDMSFTTKSNLQTHIKTVHLNMIFHACSQCTKSYSEKRNLNRHIKEVHMKTEALKTQEKQVHLIEKPEGNIEKFTSFVLGNHVTENSKIDEFQDRKRNSNKCPINECPICQKPIAGHSNSNLKRHIEIVHEKKQCEMCPMKFARKKALINHMKEEHMKIKTFKCKDCSKSFSTKYYKERHEKQDHCAEKPFQKYTCNECKTSYEEKEQIESHINSVHLNERPYKQPGYADLEPQFTLKKKEGERLSYICNLCKPKNSVISVNVKSRSNLKRHLTSQHSKKDVENYESIKKMKKESAL